MIHYYSKKTHILFLTMEPPLKKHNQFKYYLLFFANIICFFPLNVAPFFIFTFESEFTVHSRCYKRPFLAVLKLSFNNLCLSPPSNRC